MKQSTEIIAKKTTICPICKSMLYRGERAKVYHDVWFHADRTIYDRPCYDIYREYVEDKKKLTL